MSSLVPGSTIGILGDGQLGRMLTLAAARLGMCVHIYGPDENGPARDVAAGSTVAAYDDMDALSEFAHAVDVVTYEFENVPAQTAAAVASHTPLHPGEKALAVSQDRLDEKTFISGLGIEVAGFRKIDNVNDLRTARDDGFGSAILKTRRLGYDGKGQVRLSERESNTALEDAFAAIGSKPAILEQLIDFSGEMSIVAARAKDGAFIAFDPARNVHSDGILATSTVPADVDPAMLEDAIGIARTIADALNYVGVIAVELFIAGTDGAERLLVNEIAPRVHNSGHWTMDACVTCQFEQHIRAICGWPLGDASRHSDAVMTNLIGKDVERWDTLAAQPGTSVHLYGKREIRSGRKMGHANTISPERPH